MTTTCMNNQQVNTSNVNLSPRIRFAPLISVNAFTDITTNEIFISQYQFILGNAQSIVVDELAHLIAKDADHTGGWRQACLDLWGIIPDHSQLLDINRRRLGIPKVIGANIGNISGIQQVLTDYVLLQQYRRFSQRVLGNEGHWEVLGDNKIRLYPTPKGSFPVVMLYIPAISTWRTPANRQLAMDMMLAESMIMLGNARGKFAGIPSPDGSSITFDGSDLKQKGFELRDKVIEDARLLSDDPQASAIYRW